MKLNQSGNMAVILCIIILLGLSALALFINATKSSQQNIQDLTLPSTQQSNDSSDIDKLQSNEFSASYCKGLYLLKEGKEDDFLLPKSYDLQKLKAKAEEMGYLVGYDPMRFSTGGGLENLNEQGIPLQKNDRLEKNGVVYISDDDGYQMYKPVLTIIKTVDNVNYRVIINLHWQLDGRQTVEFTTNISHIPAADGKSDIIPEQTVKNNFKDVLDSLEIDSDLLTNSKVLQNGCPAPQ